MGKARRPRREEDGEPLIDRETVDAIAGRLSRGVMRIAPVARRVRWERVVVAGIGFVVVPCALFSGVASGHDREPPVVDDSFIGPRAVVGYSPITNAERKAEAEEEIRRYNEEHGIVTDDGNEDAEAKPELLDQTDKRQHEGDLDFQDAVRDNYIARAVRSWVRPTWANKIDWEGIKDELDLPDEELRDENWAPVEEDGGEDSSTDGYDDIMRVAFADDVPFSWETPSGTRFSYDGDGRMSGDTPMCLDLEEDVSFGKKAILVLDREDDPDTPNRVTFDEGYDGYHAISCMDKVVPDDADGTIMLLAASGSQLRGMEIWRRGLEASLTRAERDDADDSNLGMMITALAPPGMMSDESISAAVDTGTLDNIKVRVSCLGATISTTDEQGLRGTKVVVRYKVAGEEHEIEETLDTDDMWTHIDIDLDR